MYIAARLLLGFGIPTCIVSGAALIGELGYPKERAYLTCYFNVAYYFGQILAAGICFGTNNIPGDMAWKIPSWLQMCPSLMQMAFILYVSISPAVNASLGVLANDFQLHSREPPMAHHPGQGRGGIQYPCQIPC